MLVLRPSNIGGDIRTWTSGSWRLYIAAPLEDQVTSTMTQYPMQSHYPDTELTSLCTTLVMPSSVLGSDRHKLYKSLVWLDWNSNSRPSAPKSFAPSIRPPRLVAKKSWVGDGGFTSKQPLKQYVEEYLACDKARSSGCLIMLPHSDTMLLEPCHIIQSISQCGILLMPSASGCTDNYCFCWVVVLNFRDRIFQFPYEKEPRNWPDGNSEMKHRE